ncbi:MAG: alpha/beta fold hydrolase [Rhodospirillaceae bacterium]|nr:MAG: alpha/beta fold hydrolase [Rhodospirillaceae bacterium]
MTLAARERLANFADGVARYQAHGQRRQLAAPDAAWERGAATLRDYGGTGPAVLVVPSLINRSTVLDLAPDRSLLRTMAAEGLHTFLLDWGCPGETERSYTVEDYICRVLIPAVDEVARRTSMPVRVVGYCMGGTLAVASAVLAPTRVAALAAVAAPWDFHAGTLTLRSVLTVMRPALEMLIGVCGEAPFDLIQALFANLDPTLVGRKFRRFAALDPDSDEARRFVVLEDWLNDPVPLTAAVARECLFAWYADNTPARGLWRVAGTAIDPSRVVCPCLAMIPSRDRIVPPESAQALARSLPNATIRPVPLGHIGMMASSRAADVTYRPLIAWLKDATDV